MDTPNVHFDGELMHQITPCMPISKTSSHHVVRDSSDGHMVFSIGDSGELFLLRPNGFNGQYSLLDLRLCLGVPAATKIAAFAVSQDFERQISLAFVAAGANDKSENQLWVLKPQAAALFEALDEKSELALIVIQGEGTKKNVRIEKLFLGNVPDPSTGYPVLVAIYHRLDRNVIDAAHIQVNVPESKWTYNVIFRLPEDPSQMIDMACGNLPTGDFGLFYLYLIQGITTLSFCSISTPGIVFALQAGQDSTSIATFINNDGNTDLIVASGHELHHYTAFVCSESRFNDSPPAYKVISSDPSLLKGLQQLSLSQTSDTASPSGSNNSGGNLTIFSRNEKSTVVYQTFGVELVVDDHPDVGEVSSLTAQSKATPLLTAEEGGGRFAALLEPATGNHKLFIVNSAGSVLTLMEQSSTNKLWQSLTMLVPSTGTNREVITFTSHVKLLGPQRQTLAFKEVLLKASSPVDLAVNAKSTRVTTEGVRVAIDTMSTLTIIHNVSDISTVLLTISDVPGIQEPVLGGGSVTFDPSKKVQASLQSLAGSADKLRSAKLPSGEKLIPSDVKDQDINFAASALGNLSSKMEQLNKESKDPQPSEGSHTDLEAGESVAIAAVDSEVSEWSLWNWITTSGSQIKNWFVSAWEFVVETAEGIYRFVLKTVSHVMKAITFVFEKIKVGLKKLAEFFAFLFNWDDILDMRTVLVQVVNVGIETLGDALDIFGDAAGNWFNELDQQLTEMDVPDSAKNHKISPNEPAETEHSNALDSPGGNWTNYQLQHGDVGKSLLSPEASSPSPSKGGQDPFSDTWTQVILPILGRIRDLLSHLGSNFLALFTNKELSLGDLLKHLGVDLIRDLVGIIRDLVVGLMKFSSILVRGLQNVMNAEIEIPLLSTLYRKISGNHNLTMVDAICLLVAIPSTVFYKVVTKKRPRDDPIIKDFLDSRLKKESINLKEQPGDTITIATIAMAPPLASGGGSKMQTRHVAKIKNTLRVSNMAMMSSSESVLGTKSMSMAIVPSPADGKGRPRDWLHIVWDRLCWLCGKSITFIKLLPQIIGFCMPAINGISAYLAPIDWFKPDAPDIMGPAAANPADHYNAPTKVWIGIGILCCVGTFPLDCLNPMIEKLHKFEPRPAPEARVTFWVLGMLYVPALVCFKNKKTLTKIQVGIAVLQIPCVAWSIYKDLTATAEEYPHRDDRMVALAAGERGCAQVARIAAAIASHGNGITTPALFALPFATTFSAASVAAQVGIVALCYESGTYHEVGSLFGL